MKYDDYLAEISSLYKDGESTLTISEIMKKRYKDINWYPMKISRMLQKAENNGLVEIRDSSEAQKLAIEKGRTEHPTEGKERTEEEKAAISNGISSFLDSLSSEELEKRSEAIRKGHEEKWNSLSEKEKRSVMSKMNQAKVGVSRSGTSKVETAIYKELVRRGISCVPKYQIEKTGMEIDILINVGRKSYALEVDGPTHFRDIYGEKNLEKVIEKDSKKDIILKESGFYVIRARDMTSSVSKRRIEKAVDEILAITEKNKKFSCFKF